MKNKRMLLAFFLLATCADCFAQSSFQGISPGTSTRNDVARILGQPVRTISATLVEYAPPAGIAKVEAEYRAATSLVERIEVYFVKPISAQALIQKFGLAQADAKGKSTDETLVEYFGGTSLVALTYASTDSSGGVSHIGYYSRELFASVAGKSPARQKPETQAGASGSGSGAAGVGEMKLPDYMRGPGESTSATADRRGRASASGRNSSSASSGGTKQTKDTTGATRSSDGGLPMTVTARADGIEVQPSTRPGTTGNNNASFSEAEISLSASELRRFVGTYEFVQPIGVKPAEVRLVAGKLRLTMGAVTYKLDPIFGDDFVVGDQGASDVFRFSAAGDLGVKVYFTIGEDKSSNENRRQPKRFSIAVAKP